MDVLHVLDVVAPVLAAVGLVVLTNGLGRIVLTQLGPHSIRPDRDRNVVLMLSLILFLANHLHDEDGPKWARLIVPIAALVYVAAAFSARLRRTLFGGGRNESNVT